jgi:cobalamin synthase
LLLLNLTALGYEKKAIMKHLGPQQGTAFLMAFLAFQYAGAAQLEERQNPAFITALPTVAATTLSTSSTTPSLDPPQQPDPGFTSSPSTINVPSSPALIPPAVLPSSTQISSTIPPATSFRPTTTRPTQAAAASAVETVEDHYFGGIPKPSPDAPVTGIFLVLFILGALVYGWMYWRNAKRPTRGSNGDRLSALMICFCLAEALVCIFRLSWASTDKPAIIFLALVSESVG